MIAEALKQAVLEDEEVDNETTRVTFWMKDQRDGSIPKVCVGYADTLVIYDGAFQGTAATFQIDESKDGGDETLIFGEDQVRTVTVRREAI